MATLESSSASMQIAFHRKYTSMCHDVSRTASAAGTESPVGRSAYRRSVSSTFISAVSATLGTAMSGWRPRTQAMDSSTVRCARKASSCRSHQATWAT